MSSWYIEARMNEEDIRFTYCAYKILVYIFYFNHWVTEALLAMICKWDSFSSRRQYLILWKMKNTHKHFIFINDK